MENLAESNQSANPAVKMEDLTRVAAFASSLIKF